MTKTQNFLLNFRISGSRRTSVLLAAVLWSFAALTVPSFPQQPELRTDLQVKDKMTPLQAPRFINSKADNLYDIFDILAEMQNTPDRLSASQAESIAGALRKAESSRTTERQFANELQKILRSEQVDYVTYLNSTGQLDEMPAYEPDPSITDKQLKLNVQKMLKEKEAPQSQTEEPGSRHSKTD